MAKKMNDELRARYVNLLKDYLDSLGEDTMFVESNELAFPVVDSAGNEATIVVTVKVPAGTRDGDPYDPYSHAEDYRMRQEAKAAKAKEKERLKAEKLAKQKK